MLARKEGPTQLSLYVSVKMAPRYEIAVGLRRGHRTSKITCSKNRVNKQHKIRPARLKGVNKQIHIFSLQPIPYLNTVDLNLEEFTHLFVILVYLEEIKVSRKKLLKHDNSQKMCFSYLLGTVGLNNQPFSFL